MMTMMREWLMHEAEKFRLYLNLEKIRSRHDALFFNELRRFFREELIILLALPEFGEKKIKQLLDTRLDRLKFLLSPLYQGCTTEFYSYELGQKSLYRVFQVSQDTITFRCQKIVDHTKDQITQAFYFPDKAREKIAAMYSANGRAMRIAKTEVTTASNLGLFEAAKVNGKREKIWICSREDNVRHGHRSMDGQRVDITETYSNGLLFPGDPKGTIGQVINCRCFQTFV